MSKPPPPRRPTFCFNSFPIFDRRIFASSMTKYFSRALIRVSRTLHIGERVEFGLGADDSTFLVRLGFADDLTGKVGLS
jgi:hypothetical protein